MTYQPLNTLSQYSNQLIQLLVLAINKTSFQLFHCYLVNDSKGTVASVIKSFRLKIIIKLEVIFSNFIALLSNDNLEISILYILRNH